MVLFGLPKNNWYKVILTIAGITLLVMSVILFLVPPPLSYDPAQGFLTLRSMVLGGSFNTFVSPDQNDISKNVTEFSTWWSPGQYYIPYIFKLITGLNMGRCLALVIILGQFTGLAGLYYFFKAIGFSKNVAVFSLVFIICQQAFMMPYAYYNGGEILIFALEGWFLYGCLVLKRPGLKLVLFVLLSAFIGFFLKSAFLWVYTSGLCCLWLRLVAEKRQLTNLIKKALWIGFPAVLSLVIIYISFIAKGESPATAANGFKLTLQAFTYPLASPILSGFSVDDMLHGLIDPMGEQVVAHPWNIIIVSLTAVLSVLLVISIIRKVPHNNYRLFVLIFYLFSLVFFTASYLRQLDISMDPRHFRIIGIVLTPGTIYLVSGLKPVYKVAFAVICIGLAFNSFLYLITSYKTNSQVARGATGLAQPNIDQSALNQLIKFDRQNTNLTFVLFGSDIGFEIWHNRIIALRSIDDDFNLEDYHYAGHAGPLYIVMPQNYRGTAEKVILNSFPGYKDFKQSRLSKYFILYTAQ